MIHMSGGVIHELTVVDQLNDLPIGQSKNDPVNKGAAGQYQQGNAVHVFAFGSAAGADEGGQQQQAQGGVGL